MIPFNLTNNTLTLIVKGAPRVIQSGTAQYTAIRKEILKDAPDWAEVERLLNPTAVVATYLRDGFTCDTSGNIFYQDKPVPKEIVQRAEKMAAEGKSPEPLMAFWERLKKNPSSRSVEQLYPFLTHEGIAIEPDGTFLAYKGVRSDLKDKHSGKFDNSPGQVHKLPRNEISDDPNHACHYGFHVGALAYAKDFADTVVICRVDPENVVCIPYDCGQQKMRVCEYEVVGFWTGEAPLASTVEEVDVEPGEIPEEAFAPDDEDESEEAEFLDGEEEGLEEPDVQKPADDYEDEQGITAGRSRPARPLPKDTLNLRKLARSNARALLDETLDTLRAYAGKLKIVGASKLPGGKTALISKIVKARKRVK